MAITSEEKAAIATEVGDAVITRLANAGVLNPPKTRKKRTNWERTIAWEWTNARYPNSPRWFRCRVGDYPESGKTNWYEAVRKFADVIVRTDEGIVIAECKMRGTVAAVAQLEQYMNLFPMTPEFRRYKDAKVRGVLVAAMVDDAVLEVAKAHGVEIDVYKPSNFDQWYNETIVQIKK